MASTNLLFRLLGVDDLSGALRRIGGALDDTHDRVRRLRDEMDEANKRTLDNIGSGLRGAIGRAVPGALSSLFSMTTQGGPIGLAVGAAIMAAMAAAVTIGSAAVVGALGAGLAGAGLVAGLAIAKGSPQVEAAVTSLGTTAKDGLRRATASFEQPMADAVGKIEALFTRAEPGITRVMEALAPGIGPLTDGIIGLLEGAGPGFEAFLISFADQMEIIGPLLPPIGTAVGQLLTELASNPEATRTFMAFLTGVIVTAPKVIGAVGSILGAVTTFAGGVSSAQTRASTAFSGMTTSIGGSLSRGQGMVTSFGSALDAGAQRAAAFAGRVASEVGALPGRVAGALSRLGNAGYSTGVDLVMGIASGVTGAAGRVASAAVSAVTNAINSARKAIGARSPSVVARERIGRTIPQGIAGGIDRDARLVDQSMARALAPVTQASVTPTVPAVGVPGVAGGVGGGGRGGQRVVLELRAGSGRLEQLLLELIRESVRLGGGNVQTVLSGA